MALYSVSTLFHEMLSSSSNLTSSVIPLEEKADVVQLLMHFICQSDEEMAETVKLFPSRKYTWAFALAVFETYGKYQLRRRAQEFITLLECSAQDKPIEAFIWNCSLAQPIRGIWMSSLSRFDRVVRYLDQTIGVNPASSKSLPLMRAIDPKYWHCYWTAYSKAMTEQAYENTKDIIPDVGYVEENLEELHEYTFSLEYRLDWAQIGRLFLRALDDYEDAMTKQTEFDPKKKVEEERKESLKRKASDIEA